MDGSTLQEIREQVARCRACKLGMGSARPVPGEGNPNAKIMFIGEAPGFYEDQQGKPFVGPAGQFLDELLKLAGLSRADVFITNVVKHRPPGNRDPEPDELEACDGFLRAQIAAIRPKLIVTLGRHSLSRFVSPVRSMRDVHGRAIPCNGMTVCAMYHPAAALHQGSLRAVLEQDFRNLPAIIARIEQRETAETPVAVSAPAAPEPQQMSLW
ncbi:MAG TPA: uracil-DNA glycosylase [Chloroflexota bacterium]|nr:uracil-DNA glycosylase [Chloroflexota bacterium]